METVTLGAVHVVAEGEGVDAEAVGLGDLEGVSELEGPAVVEAPAGSTVSCLLRVGPQALRGRAAIRASPGVRRRVLQGP